MLDAYIIEKIRQDQERRDQGRAPLRIENERYPRRPDPEERRHEPDRAPDRGVVVIDL